MVNVKYIYIFEQDNGTIAGIPAQSMWRRVRLLTGRLKNYWTIQVKGQWKLLSQWDWIDAEYILEANCKNLPNDWIW